MPMTDFPIELLKLGIQLVIALVYLAKAIVELIIDTREQRKKEGSER